MSKAARNVTNDYNINERERQTDRQTDRQTEFRETTTHVSKQKREFDTEPSDTHKSMTHYGTHFRVIFE